MARASVVLVTLDEVDNHRKDVLKIEVTPATTLAAVRDQAVAALRPAPAHAHADAEAGPDASEPSAASQFALLDRNGNPVDLSLPMRLAGLPANSKLRLATASKYRMGKPVPSAARQKGSGPGPASGLVSVAVLFHTSDACRRRVVLRVPPNTTVAQCLARAELDATSIDQILLDDKQVLNKNSMLSELGVQSGSAVIQVGGVVQVIKKLSSTVSQLPPGSQMPEDFETPAEDDAMVKNEKEQEAIIPAAHETIVIRPPRGDQPVAIPAEDDSFFELGAAELKALAGEFHKDKDADVLMTKKMREQRKEAKSTGRKIISTRIRLQFPDRWCIEKVFSVAATVGDLYDLLESSLKAEVLAAATRETSDEMYLFVAPPVRKLTDRTKTLAQEQLTPAARIMVHVASQPTDTVLLLKPSLLDCAVDHPVSGPNAGASSQNVNKDQPARAMQAASNGTSAAGAADGKKKVPSWFKK
ncbi:Tether containing UBX domain for GLUT4 [Porphyridium purpureum]|uniref:Tether containing UBX domain for GLUT4 n=1 Tax=Porphyridium purpureum TaxID=35688 RepID=A0A5J4YX71_PORPP|nr:Tether containing UBX domain for GLUT4 [Porphyridium purpureum]|eukprot:POR7383..scf209_3